MSSVDQSVERIQVIIGTADGGWAAGGRGPSLPCHPCREP
jgi:hypothetical protein